MLSNYRFPLTTPVKYWLPLTLVHFLSLANTNSMCFLSSSHITCPSVTTNSILNQLTHCYLLMHCPPRPVHLISVVSPHSAGGIQQPWIHSGRRTRRTDPRSPDHCTASPLQCLSLGCWWRHWRQSHGRHPWSAKRDCTAQFIGRQAHEIRLGPRLPGWLIVVLCSTRLPSQLSLA